MHGTWSHWEINGKLSRQVVYDSGVFVREIQLPNNAQNHQILKKGEVESEYPGGMGAWKRFLNENMNYPDRAVNARVTGEVRISFVVDAEGKVRNPEIFRSVEYSIDEEALRIIKLSGQWVPASKDQVKVKSYKIQPITFSLEYY